jgi:hypothetical protein
MTSEESSGPSSDQTITEHELEECKRANATGRPPVVFVHGLWLLPSSWDRWATLFEKNGYAALTPGWPDDPETVEEAKAHPEVFAGKSIGQVADHFETIIRGLERKPAVIGHSFGGLLTQILGTKAGMLMPGERVTVYGRPDGKSPLLVSSAQRARAFLGTETSRSTASPGPLDEKVSGATLVDWAAWAASTTFSSTARLLQGYHTREVDAFRSAVRDTFLGAPFSR